ncbi:Protease inhibitor Inh [Rhizobium sp. RU20A]|uniref:protease inhibitor Inh/omp19 family protein n=1 Tax=Rhizobium sp. RU20A TaxID=1907412 RepID=UPI000956E4B7|nr:protease inhibitor Inh/omp19 family protein [Rhizobium sp. RU20A]SIQ90506.1 Protease inhibitor Inh [Rhizobium sp. RU20A]
MQLLRVAAGLLAVTAIAGCQRTGMNDFAASNNQPYQPAPLQAQPVPGVQSSQLPDPTVGANASQFPAAPVTATTTMPGQAANVEVAANALDVKKEGMVGNWRVSNGGTSCDMFLTLTNLGSGSRGGTRGCVGELTTMGSWEVAGKQVVLKDRSGNPIGRVFKTADNRFDGQTNSGQPLSLSR